MCCIEWTADFFVKGVASRSIISALARRLTRVNQIHVWKCEICCDRPTVHAIFSQSSTTARTPWSNSKCSRVFERIRVRVGLLPPIKTTFLRLGRLLHVSGHLSRHATAANTRLPSTRVSSLFLSQPALVAALHLSFTTSNSSMSLCHA